MVIFLDTNVFIDYLIERPHSDCAKQIIEYSFETNSKIYISATTIVNCFYILRKDFSVQELRDALIDILEFIDIVGTSKTNIIESLNNFSFLDFEDCVQSECAKTVAADYIITRNVADFEESKILTLEPEEFLKQFK